MLRLQKQSSKVAKWQKGVRKITYEVKQLKKLKKFKRSNLSANVSNLSNSQYNRVSYVITEVARGPSLCFGIALKRCILNSLSLALASLNNTLCISVQLRVSS